MREQIQKLYPRAQWETQVARYQEGAEQFRKLFGYDHAYIFSAPGRSEICGNHTDHNLGKAVGAAIDLDVLAFVGPREDSIITIHSEGYAPFMVDLTDLSLQESEKGSSSALVRGIAYKMAATDRKIGGFDAYTTSNVCKGSGLSSSAAFEVTIVSILDHLYNNGELPAMEMAKIAQFAENVYFGKASGLLDQLSCAHGGMIAIDFQDPDHPIATPLPFDFNQTGYDLVITDVGTDHADLTADYVAIKEEMESIAAFFGEKYLRKVDPNAFYQKLPHLRENISERALLRAIHFFQENERVGALQNALEQKDFEAFKRIVCASGNSSYMYLQNIYSDRKPTEQAISLALCLAQQMLDGKGAWRVHGGGFGGTIQAYVPAEETERYCAEMERVFGNGCCHILQIRPFGPIQL